MIAIDLVALSASVSAALAAHVISRFVLATYAVHPNVFIPKQSSRGPLAWIFGHTVEAFMGGESYGVAPQRWMLDAHRANKKVVQLRMLTKVLFMPLSPRDIEYMLADAGAPNYRKPSHYDAMKLILGQHGLVAMTNATDHKIQRRLVTRCFSPAALKTIAHSTSVAIDRAMRGISKRTGTIVAVEEVFDKMTLEVISSATFGSEGANGSGRQLESIFQQMSESLAKSLFLFLPGGHFVRTSAVRSVMTCRDSIRTKASEFVAASRLEPDSNADLSLVDAMCQVPELSDDMISDHCLTFLFAGYDTTATTISWASYLLAKNFRVQQTLLEELTSAFSLNVFPELETVQNLQFLNNTLKEVLRLHCPIGSLVREAIEDDLLPDSGVVIPAGSAIEFSLCALHRDPELWGADADQFRPSRWDSPSLEGTVGRGGYFPFFLGKRNCIGKDLAWNEMLVALATLVRRFELCVPSGEAEPRMKQKISIRSDVPIRISFVERKQ